MPVTSPSRPTLTQLRARITDAFDDVPHPGDDALVTGDVSYDPEYREVARAFSGKTWHLLSRAFVRAHADALPLLTAAAFRHFLPAYLLACLETGPDLDTTPLNVLSSLTPPDDSDSAARSRFSQRVAAFSEQESRAIRTYLEAAETEDASNTERALAYWRSRTS